MRILVLLALLLALPASAHELTRGDLETWLDGMLPWALQRSDIAGAAIVVVQDGRVLFQKGYGHAAQGVAVDPQTTLFRIGSVTKLVTWTAVLQLVEQGRLDLDKDVDAYLDFHIPATFAQPVTLRHLLTHTAGFEDVFENVMPPDAASTPSLESYLKQAIPARIQPPGAVVAYSNYGAALAGYIVQRVAGEPYETYVAKHIFAPLGMKSSTFAQPAPVTGYVAASGPVSNFEFIATVPAGAMTSTASDMARFMLAHLDQGGALLKPETARLMHGEAWRPAPQVNAMSLGFYGDDRNGLRIIGHGGDLISFHADLKLLLDHKIGIFVALNSLGKDVASSAVRSGILRGFLDRYFPVQLPDEPALPTAAAHGAQIAGLYDVSRRNESGLASLANLFNRATLAVHDDGTVSLSTLKDLDGEPKRWREVQDFVWRERNGPARLVAVRDGERVRYLTTDELPPIALFQPASRFAGLQLPLLFATLAVQLVTLLAWPVTSLVRRAYGVRATMPKLGRLVRLAVLFDFIALVGWLGFLVAGMSDLTVLADRSDWMLRLLQLAGLVGLLGLVPAGLRLAQVLRGARFWPGLGNLLIAASCVATAWFAVAFHLLQLSLSY